MSKVARDVFANPISSVPSKFAFSVGKRVVDHFEACLTPTTIEALICANDWLKCEAFTSTRSLLKMILSFIRLW